MKLKKAAMQSLLAYRLLRLIGMILLLVLLLRLKGSTVDIIIALLLNTSS